MLKSVAQEPAGEATPPPFLSDKQCREVRLDLAVGLELDDAGDDSILDSDQGCGSGRRERAIGALRIFGVGLPVLGGEQCQCAVQVVSLEALYADLGQSPS